MSSLTEFFSWITINAAGLAAIATFIGVFIPLFQYISVRKSENRKHTFEAYHNLLKDLLDPSTPRLDRQVAVVFELRNFKDYYPVSIRILEGLRVEWDLPRTKLRLIKEIDLAIDYMKSRI